jgi:hypothetical protein
MQRFVESEVFGKESYFMSQEQQDAVFGRVSREKEEAEKNLDHWKSEAQSLASTYSHMADLLTRDPDHIFFRDETLPPHLENAPLPRFSNADFSSEKVRGLVNNLKNLAKVVTSKTEELERLKRSR